MELNELKKTWNKMAPTPIFNENQIREILKKRTKSLIERIDRNIKIGFVVLFAFFMIFAIDDFFISPMLIKGIGTDLSVPGWLMFLDLFSNILIIATFIYFVLQYYHVRKICNITCNMREVLLKIINTLKIYQRLFYFALIALLITIVTSFTSGMYEGIQQEAGERGITLSEIEPEKLLPAILSGAIIMIITVGGIFFFMRWGFHRLYGNYIQKLKLTLKELEEIEEENTTE